MFDPRPLDDPEYWNPFYGMTDLELAQAYLTYFESTGSSWFHHVFDEVQRRGLSLESLEQLTST